ncbi:MAG: PilZ domain-containing protein [Proteobacteria bacterium]|nr:PilZ domain-containing protein [Pseudomonadota bacterium]
MDDQNCRRTQARHSTGFDTRLVCKDRVLNCRINNISVGGARVEIDGAFDAKSYVKLSLGAFGEFACEIVWQDGARLGLRFLNTAEEMAEVIMGIAAYG